MSDVDRHGDAVTTAYRRFVHPIRRTREGPIRATCNLDRSAEALLIGAVLLFGEHGTFLLPELFDRARGGTTTAVAGGLIAVAALAKSAHAPLHFWLPRAMDAPTPVWGGRLLNRRASFA